MAKLNKTYLKSYWDPFVEQACEIGMPGDQTLRFGDAHYIPQPRQMVFHAACRACDEDDGPDQVGFGGARGPGKSHATFAQVALDDCQRFPGLKVLYIRKIAKNAREQFEDLRRTVLRHTEHEYNRSGVISFPNDSRIVTGHFRTEGDVDQYLGLEYDLIAIEEATTLSLAKYKTLRDSNRTSKRGWRPRIYLTTNPGNIGHVWFKERFISPARRGREQDTRFIFATVEDNTFIDPGYRKRLEENTGWKLRAYRYGDWDIAAGQYFSTWNYDRHVFTTDFEIPRTARIWLAMDYGFNHPTVVLLMMEHDGIVYVLDEHWRQKWLPPQHAEGIRAMLARHRIRPEQVTSFYAGADVFAQGKDAGAKTIADQYKDVGFKLRRAPMDRINGWGEVLKLLGDPMADPEREKVIEPRLFIHQRCVKLIECMPALQHDPHRPEDVLKTDVDDEGQGGDDAGDTLRYGLMARLLKIGGPPDLGRTSTWSIGQQEAEDED